MASEGPTPRKKRLLASDGFEWTVTLGFAALVAWFWATRPYLPLLDYFTVTAVVVLAARILKSVNRRQ